MFNLGPAEVAILFGITLLIFGPKKLPELGKSLGQGIGNFKKSLQDAQDEMKTALKADQKKDEKADEAGAAIASSDETNR